VVGVPLAVFAGESVPQAAEQAAPFCVSVQFTPWPAKVDAKVAVNCCVPFTGTLAEAGEIETAWTVIVTDADWLGSATEVAVSVTVPGEFGAV